MKVRKLLIQLLQKQSLVILESSMLRVGLYEFANLVQNIVDIHDHLHNISGFSLEVKVYKSWLNDPVHPNQTDHQETARLMFRKLSIFDPLASTWGGK